MKSNLSEFCDKLGISNQIKNAFAAYLRSVYSDKYHMSSDGETIHVILNKMSQDDLSDAWQDFVRDLAKHLTQRPE